MARSVTFSGVTAFKPGGISRVRADNLTPIGGTATGIVALLGEAEGGAPGSVITIDDPVTGAEIFREGPLADAIKVAFQPSSDTRMPGGAFRVLAYKTNVSTQASVGLPGARLIASSTAAAGSTTTQVKWATAVVPTGTALAGFWLKATLVGGAIETRRITTVESDNIKINVTPAFSSMTAANVISILSNELLATSMDYGVHTNNIAIECEAGATAGTKITTVYADGKQEQTPEVGGDTVLRMMYTGGAVANSGLGFGVVTAANTTTVTFSAQGASLADVYKDLVIDLGGGLRRLCSTSGVGGAGPAYSVILTLASGHALTTAQAAALTATPTTIYVRDVTAATATVFGKAGVAQGIVTYVNAVENLEYSFTSNQTIKSFKDVTNSGGSYLVSIPAGVKDSLTLKTFDFGTSSGGNSAVDIRFDAAVSPTTKGGFKRNLQALIDRMTLQSSFVTTSRWLTEAALPVKTATTTTGSTTTVVAFAATPFSASAHIGQWLTVSGETVYITSNDTGNLTVFPALSAAPTTGLSLSIYGYGCGGEFPANTGGVYTTALDAPIYLSGGSRGVSVNGTSILGAPCFQVGFDKLLLQRHNHIVPLIEGDLVNEGNGSTATWDSVAAMLVSHVQSARAGGKNECGGYIGYNGSKTTLITKLANLNDTDVQLTGQTIEVLNSQNDMTVLPYWSMAVAAAGMRAGAPEVGEPLTFKYMKTNSLTNDSSWNPANITDVNTLIEKGLLFAEQTDRGVRFVRDLTTYVNEDNIAFIAGSTRDATRYVSYDFRTSLENTFTGIKATPTTVTNVKEHCIRLLKSYLDQNIIVGSFDENNVFIETGYRNLRVWVSGNVMYVRVEIWPVTGIDFILLDMVLQNVKLSA